MKLGEVIEIAGNKFRVNGYSSNGLGEKSLTLISVKERPIRFGDMVKKKESKATVQYKVIKVMGDHFLLSSSSGRVWYKPSSEYEVV